jgi:hypothetical protein
MRKITIEGSGNFGISIIPVETTLWAQHAVPLRKKIPPAPFIKGGEKLKKNRAF